MLVVDAVERLQCKVREFQRVCQKIKPEGQKEDLQCRINTISAVRCEGMDNDSNEGDRVRCVRTTFDEEHYRIEMG